MRQTSIRVFSGISNGHSSLCGFPHPANFTSAGRMGTLTSQSQAYKRKTAYYVIILTNYKKLLFIIMPRYNYKYNSCKPTKIMFTFSVKMHCVSLRPDKCVESISFSIKTLFTSMFTSLQSPSSLPSVGNQAVWLNTQSM